MVLSDDRFIRSTVNYFLCDLNAKNTLVLHIKRVNLGRIIKPTKALGIFYFVRFNDCIRVLCV